MLSTTWLNHLGTQVGELELWDGVRGGEGGSARRGSPACGRVGRSVAWARVQQGRVVCASHGQAGAGAFRCGAGLQGVRHGGAVARVAGERCTST